MLVCAALLASATTAPARARSAPPLVRVNISAKPVSAALLDFALQTKVSLGGDVALCQGTSLAISGRFSLQNGLQKLLQTSDCVFELPDARTIVIRRIVKSPASSSPRAPHPPPQAAAPSPPVIVGELVVTAGRYADLPGRTPYSITAISDEDLDRSRTRDMTDLAAQVAGMTVTNLGPGRDKVLLRGMSDGAFTGLTQSTVGLYLDDVPVTYNAPDPDLKLVDMERIEVMRGPQGTLYGGGSISGIVRIVTHKPDLDEYQGFAKATLSFTQHGGANTEVETALNVPVVAGRVALRVTAYRERDSGYIDDLTLDRTNINRAKRDGVRLAARAELTPDWTVLAGVMHQSINTSDAQYVTEGPHRLARSGAVPSPHDNDFDQAYATIEGRGSWGRLTWSTAWLQHNLDSRYDASDALYLFSLSPPPAAFDEIKDIDLLVSELTWASPDDGRLRWLAGAFASVGRTDDINTLTRLEPSTITYREDRSDIIDEVAIYGELGYDFTERLNLVTGVRWFQFEFDTKSTVAQAPLERIFKGGSDASGLSPKLSLRYRLNDQTNLYALVAEGYRPGEFNTGGPIGQIFDDVPGGVEREVLPDELWNYELGAKFSLLDDQLKLRMAFFYAVWSDMQSDQFLPSGLPYTVNIGDAANAGAEFEAAWRPTPNLSLRAAALINEPQLARANPGFPARSNAALPGVPKASATVAASYTYPLGGELELRLDGQVSYVGASRLTFDTQETYPMGDYVTGRLSAALAAGRWTIRAFVDNPLNSRANTFSFGDPFRLGRDQVATPLRPRTLGVQIGATF